MHRIMKNKKLLCSVCFLFTFMSVLWGQSITVKGNVTSKTDGQPVIGASVVEATATANGTITDLDGNFTLSVPANSTLKITYIGYKPVTVKSAAIVNVLLEEDTQMVQNSFCKSCLTCIDMSHNTNVSDRKSTRLNSSHKVQSRMPSSA